VKEALEKTPAGEGVGVGGLVGVGPAVGVRVGVAVGAGVLVGGTDEGSPSQSPATDRSPGLLKPNARSAFSVVLEDVKVQPAPLDVVAA